MPTAGNSTELQGGREARGSVGNPVEHAPNGHGFQSNKLSSDEYGEIFSSRRKRKCLHGNFPAYYAGRRAFVRSHTRSQQRSVHMDWPADGGCGLTGRSSFERRMRSPSMKPGDNSGTDPSTSDSKTGHDLIRGIDPRLDAVLSSHGNRFFEGKDVLDIGCNAGSLCLAIGGLLRARSVTGMDIDGDLVRLANSAVAELREMELRAHFLRSTLTLEKTLESAAAYRTGTGTPATCVSDLSPPLGNKDKRANADAGKRFTWRHPAKPGRDLSTASAVQAHAPTKTGLDNGCEEDKGVDGVPHGSREIPESAGNATLKQPGAGGLTRSPGPYFSRVFGRVLWNELVAEATTRDLSDCGSTSISLRKAVRLTKQANESHVASSLESGSTEIAASAGNSNCISASPDRNPIFPFNVYFRSSDIVEGVTSHSSTAPVEDGRELASPLESRQCFCEILRHVRRAAGVLPEPALLRPGSFDVVLCFSVTKWIHLHHGDRGILVLFSRLHTLLKPDGILLLEPQDWASYRRARRLSCAFKQQLRRIRLPPKMFTAILTGNNGCTNSPCSSCCLAYGTGSCEETTPASTGLSAGPKKPREQTETTAERRESDCNSLRCDVTPVCPQYSGSPQGSMTEKADQPFVLVSSLDPWNHEVQIDRNSQIGGDEGAMLRDSRPVAEQTEETRPCKFSVDEEFKLGDVTSSSREEGCLEGVFNDIQRCPQAPVNDVSQKDTELLESRELNTSESRTTRESKGRLSDRRILVLRKSSSIFSLCCCTLKMLTTGAVERYGPKPLTTHSQS
ncbi:putative Bin3 domain-containing protein [Neospora caninum Liverpool]|uniref:RNA methyltransferase n=1 Tax=Neospora caninum (strain Liverpool) TaxID=572307 RepID=F0VJ74_NEOCL|nr:putative Bin3 domain-containing protein [Neospora caninum Liverpool]CBZ53785.1 putative Bin3 domain-containing protein [Neospora caninum Liverpool]CEL67778.1 TPA: Bin3 domain-containing protein, putative [Neospora caninum Liverpool]|eukprot:XP_003883817.1 putative Bin3 domain-containing protein [Neospora caninum Liverpool]